MIKVYAVLLVGILSVSLSSILIKFTYDVPAIIISTYRLTVSSVILLSWAKYKNISLKTANARDFFIAVLSGFFLSIHFISWIASIKYTSIASSVTLVSTSPVFVIIFSLLFLREKPSTKTLIATAMAILGSALIAYSDNDLTGSTTYPNPILGDLLAIVGAIAVSIYFMAGSHLRKYLTTFQYITLVYSFSALFTFIFALFSTRPFFGYRPVSYLLMVLMAIIPQLFGHTSFNWALKHIKANAVAIATLGEPVGASILAYLIFHQSVTLMQFLGIAIVLLSIAAAIKESFKSN